MTGTNLVIKIFRNLFARFGIPKKIVSDNATCFTSSEMLTFLEKKNGIKTVTISPYHPPSNGAAENAVKTVKAALIKVLSLANVDITLALSRFLFDYRNTTHCTTGVPPATLMFGRRLRTRFDIILPNNSIPQVKKHVSDKQQKQRLYHKGNNKAEFALKELVLVKDYRIPNKVNWIKGQITKRI